MSLGFTLTDLGRFSGTQTYTKHWAGSIQLTDGVAFIATHGAGWFVDLIAVSQLQCGQMPFQEWSCRRTPDAAAHSGAVTCSDGNGELIASVPLELLDWPVGRPLVVWVVNNVALLPGEY